MSFDELNRGQELCRNILEAYQFIEIYLNNLTKSEFLSDHKTQDAVSMRLQQVLECAGKFSELIKNKIQIQWSALVAMRNKISHSYIDIEPLIIWQVLMDYPEFQQLLKCARKNI